MFTIGGRELESRLILGTGGFRNLSVMAEAAEESGAEATVAMRRVDPNARGSIVEVLSEAGLEVLPNTAGCFTARDAIATAKLAREALETDWVKLEVIGDDHTAAGSGGAAARRRGAGGGWLHGAALHERRPDLGPPARGRRLRRRDAARLADRQRHGHQQTTTCG